VIGAQSRHTPASPVATPLDLAQDPQLIARGFLREVEHPDFGRMLFPVGAIASLRGTQPDLAPRLGQHDEEVFCGEFGVPRDQLAKLKQSGVVV